MTTAQLNHRHVLELHTDDRWPPSDSATIDAAYKVARALGDYSPPLLIRDARPTQDGVAIDLSSLRRRATIELDDDGCAAILFRRLDTGHYHTREFPSHDPAPLVRAVHRYFAGLPDLT